MFKMMVVPDYMPDQFSAWYLLNTHLQKTADIHIGLVMPESFAEVAQLQKATPAAMIYANPFDAGHYVREQGYRPLVRPREQFDEVVLVCPADAAYQRIEDLQAPLRLAISHNEDANFIGQRLLEPAGLPESDVERQHKDNFLMVASAVARGQADVGIVSVDVYAQLSDITRSRLKVLLQSRINEISHVWLYLPQWQAQADALQPVLTQLHTSDQGRQILTGLGMPAGFETLNEESMEFMIDLVDTLRD